MKLLIDENFPQKVSLHYPEHTIVTIESAGWKGKENSELLRLMVKMGFDGLITLDQNLAKQQNISKFKLKIFVLKPMDSRPSSVQPLVGKLESVLKNASSKQIFEIE